MLLIMADRPSTRIEYVCMTKSKMKMRPWERDCKLLGNGVTGIRKQEKRKQGTENREQEMDKEGKRIGNGKLKLDI